MKKILVTGSNGLLGQKITEQVITQNKFKLIATNRGENRFPIKTGYVYEEMDVCDYERVETVLKQYLPEVLIHTAAITSADICHDNNDLCWKVNVLATQHLANCCEQLGIHFVFVSTDFVFDGLKGPYAEDDIPQPISFYGKSKLAAENITKNCKAKWSIVRTILVYGILMDMSRSNIVLWAKQALENHQKIKVVNDQWRMPTLAEDLAWACLQIAELGADGIFHISGKDEMSIIEIVRRVAAFWQLDTTFISEINSASLAQDAKRPAKTGFLLDKARTVLNYEPHTFEQGLAVLDKQLKKF